MKRVARVLGMTALMAAFFVAFGAPRIVNNGAQPKAPPAPPQQVNPRIINNGAGPTAPPPTTDPRIINNGAPAAPQK